MDPGDADIGWIHIHRQGSERFNLTATQVSEITSNTFNTTTIPEFKRLSLRIQDNGGY